MDWKKAHTTMLRQRASCRATRLREQRVVQSFELRFDLRALEIVPNSCEVGSEDRPRYRESIVRARDRDHIASLNHFAPERSGDLLRAPSDRQYRRASCTAEIELRQTPPNGNALGNDSYRNGLTESGEDSVDVLEQLRLVR